MQKRMPRALAPPSVVTMSCVLPLKVARVQYSMHSTVNGVGLAVKPLMLNTLPTASSTVVEVLPEAPLNAPLLL